MRKLFKGILLIGLLILASGVAYHMLRLTQEQKPVTFEETGVGLRNTVDVVDDAWDTAKDKGSDAIDEIGKGYHKKDSVK
jgi:hypothetical protein